MTGARENLGAGVLVSAGRRARRGRRLRETPTPAHETHEPQMRRARNAALASAGPARSTPLDVTRSTTALIPPRSRRRAGRGRRRRGKHGGAYLRVGVVDRERDRRGPIRAVAQWRGECPPVSIARSQRRENLAPRAILRAAAASTKQGHIKQQGVKQQGLATRPNREYTKSVFSALRRNS